MIGNSLDFKKAYSLANELLCSSNTIDTFPFSPQKLVKEKSNIRCRSYSKAIKYGLDIRDFGSESATIFKKGEKEIIFYNDSKPENHTRFSILHEFGHGYLKHDFNDKCIDSYHKFEVEANFFSAQLLMPEQIIRELLHRGVGINKTFIQNYFGVSEEAAQKRIETLAKTNYEWRSREEKEFDDIILMKYSAFINSIKPKYSYFDYDYEEEMQKQRDSWY